MSSEFQTPEAEWIEALISNGHKPQRSIDGSVNLLALTERGMTGPFCDACGIAWNLAGCFPSQVKRCDGHRPDARIESPSCQIPVISPLSDPTPKQKVGSDWEHRFARFWNGLVPEHVADAQGRWEFARKRKLMLQSGMKYEEIALILGISISEARKNVAFSQRNSPVLDWLRYETSFESLATLTLRSIIHASRSRFPFRG